MTSYISDIISSILNFPISCLFWTILFILIYQNSTIELNFSKIPEANIEVTGRTHTTRESTSHTPPPREPTPLPQAERQKCKDGSNGYNLNEIIGIYKYDCFDFRRRREDLDKNYADPPTDIPFVDRYFGPGVAIKGESVEWKRPHEFRDVPVLFSNGTTRYDIRQGRADTSWFLSMVAMLADKPKLFHKVVPQDAWNPEGGYFYCYFWRFGEWEAVYIDDYLPVVHGTELWGAKSAEDRQEMWPAMLEKAFARFHGNYSALYGGQSGDAFLTLTGGFSEKINFDDDLQTDAEGTQIQKAIALHKRLKNAIEHGESMLTTESKFNRTYGLVENHPYSLTDAVTVTSGDQTVRLVRVRNPWGHTEWNGSWSDGSCEWNFIDSNIVPHANRDDGEFWMSLKDFITFFGGVTVCSMVPDFDKDGCSDSLSVRGKKSVSISDRDRRVPLETGDEFCNDHCSTIIGEWVGDTAAGFQNRIDNPRYMFEITDEGMDDDGKVPVVIQICQKLKHRKLNKAPIRVDLYKVLGERSDGHPVAVMVLQGGVTEVYKREWQMSNRYKVEPGKFAVVPSCTEAGREKEFLVRVYTPSPLYNVKEIGRDYAIMESEEFKYPDEAISISYTKTEFGRWISGYNAGGRVSNPKFYTNPQLEFEITDRGGAQLVSFTLMQEKGREIYPVGVRLFTLDPGYEIKDNEKHQIYLYEHYDSCPWTTDGHQGAFLKGSHVNITHKLDPGRYFALFHLDNNYQEKRFAVIVRSSCHIQTKMHNFE